jgi:hypothetical protein
MVAAITARCKGRETAPLERGRLIALIGRPSEEGKEGGEAGCGRICGCGGRPARQRGEEERKGGEGETDGWGPSVTESREKEKERENAAGAGRGWWAVGLFGPKGEKVRFSFFLFFFKLLFKTAFLFKFKSKLFQTFSQKFINLLETTRATKNHASQLMMHNHLLSLCLLNYV